MSVTAELLARARSVGVVLGVRAGRVTYDAPAEALTPDLLSDLRRHKVELLDLLGADGVASAPEPLAAVDVPTASRGHSVARSQPAAAPPQPAVAWVHPRDVVTVVEDLADEGIRPGKISHTLGLTRAEVVMVLRRSGR